MQVTGPKSPQTPLPKRTRAIGDAMDDLNMVAAIAEVTEVCDNPQLDWETVVSSDHVGSTWYMRHHRARLVHLQHLQEHRVHEELDLPLEVKPLSVRWVDKDNYSTAKARLTDGGNEQEVTGPENFFCATHNKLRCVSCWWWHSRWPWQLGLRTSLSPSTREERRMGHTPERSGSGAWTSMAST